MRTLSTPAHCARSPARGGRLPGGLGRPLAPLALPCGGALPGNRSGSCSGGGRRGGGVAAEQAHVSRVGANAGRLVRTGQSSSCARAAAEPDCSATRRESVTHTRACARRALPREATTVAGGGCEGRGQSAQRSRTPTRSSGAHAPVTSAARVPGGAIPPRLRHGRRSDLHRPPARAPMRARAAAPAPTVPAPACGAGAPASARGNAPEPSRAA